MLQVVKLIRLIHTYLDIVQRRVLQFLPQLGERVLDLIFRTPVTLDRFVVLLEALLLLLSASQV